MSSNLNGITDEDGAYSDWIELFNNSGSQANLNGFHISDDPANLKKWTFPDIALDPYSYLVILLLAKTGMLFGHISDNNTQGCRMEIYGSLL
ncbi:MAG: hypothetical protein IPJ37_14630 [Bacteroidales bacterium]|nr:hypothetical protein [Bacteroidales bacterium]